MWTFLVKCTYSRRGEAGFIEAFIESFIEASSRQKASDSEASSGEFHS